MTDTDDLDEILQGFGVDPDDPHRRRDKANKLRSAGVDPSGAELVFCHLERTSADLNRVPRLVAAMALDPAKLLRTVDELRGFHVKQEERRSAEAPTPASRSAAITSVWLVSPPRSGNGSRNKSETARCQRSSAAFIPGSGAHYHDATGDPVPIL